MLGMKTSTTDGLSFSLALGEYWSRNLSDDTGIETELSIPIGCGWAVGRAVALSTGSSSSGSLRSVTSRGGGWLTIGVLNQGSRFRADSVKRLKHAFLKSR